MSRTCLVLMPAMRMMVFVGVGLMWRMSIHEVPTSRRRKVPFQPCGDIRQTASIFQICEQKRPGSTHFARITLHHFERSADIRSEIDLVDNQQIGTRNSGSALARYFVSAGHVNHVNRNVDQFRAEHRGKIVAAALDEDEFETRQF